MPEWKQEIRQQLAGLHLPPAREAEIIEELSDHLTNLYAEILREGPDVLPGQVAFAVQDE